MSSPSGRWSEHERAVFTRVQRRLANSDAILERELVDELFHLVRRVGRTWYLDASEQALSPELLFLMLEWLFDPRVVPLDDARLKQIRQHLLDLFATQGRAQAVRARAIELGGHHRGELEIDDAGWTIQERLLLKRCKDAVTDASIEPNPLDHDDLLAFVDTVDDVYERCHSPRSERLRKSAGITRAIRLLASERLFPPGPERSTLFIDERIRMLIEIANESPQRPVANLAGIVLLEQDLEEQWSTRAPHLVDWFVDGVAHVTTPVLSILELAVRLGPDAAAPLLEDLRTADYDSKRLRLDELGDVLDTHGDSAGAEAIATRWLEPIFENLGNDKKLELIERLFTELERAKGNARSGWLKFVFEPIVLQNALDSRMQERFLNLALRFPNDVARPYVLFHFDGMRELDPARTDTRAVDFARIHGTRDFIPRLYPLTELRGGLFNGPTSLARRAKDAVDMIIQREGLGGAAGSLSVAQGAGGELSVARARHGALSLGDSAPDGALVPALENLPVTTERSGPNLGVIAIAVAITIAILTFIASNL